MGMEGGSDAGIRQIRDIQQLFESGHYVLYGGPNTSSDIGKLLAHLATVQQERDTAREGVLSIHASWEHSHQRAMARIIELERERDETLALGEGPSTLRDLVLSFHERGFALVAAEKRAEQAEAHLTALTGALRDYGQHRPSCAMRRPRTVHVGPYVEFLDTLPPADAVCDCGLAAALALSPVPASSDGHKE